MLPLRARCGIHLLCGWLWLTAAPALAEDWPVPRGPSTEPMPYQYDAGQWKELPAELLQQGSLCHLYAGVSWTVGDDGTVEQVVHKITRLNDRWGVHRASPTVLPVYDPALETATLNEARVHKTDGNIVRLRPVNVRVRTVSNEAFSYRDRKEILFFFPDVGPGDVIEYKWTRRWIQPLGTEVFFAEVPLSEAAPVIHAECRVRLPAGRVLKYALEGGPLEPVVRDEGTGRVYLWSTDRRQPRPEGGPAEMGPRRRLVFSTCSSWGQLGKAYQGYLTVTPGCPAEVRATALRVTAGLDSPLAKAQALADWVHEHVRYLRAPHQHGMVPEPPATVLANRYGDCKDQSNLLAVMLREVGVPAALVALSIHDDRQMVEDVPAGFLDHMILLVTVEGKDHWIDVTAAGVEWDELPQLDCGRLCLVGRDGGVQLLKTPAGGQPSQEETESLDGPNVLGRLLGTLRWSGLLAIAAALTAFLGGLRLGRGKTPSAPPGAPAPSEPPPA